MKRTKDGRICEKRIKIEAKFKNFILVQYKSISNLTWKQIAENFNVSEYTLYHDWRKENTTLPLSIFLIIIKSLNINLDNIKNKIQIVNPYWGQIVSKTFKIPNVRTVLFAEFYGILLGDGCVYSNLSGFCISGNSVLDRDYIEYYVANLIFSLFGLKPNIYLSKKCKSIRCVLYSKAISKFLINYGFPVGKKKFGKPVIPKMFFSNPDMLKFCIRGINDTDGSVYPQSNSKIILDISIFSPCLLSSTITAFNKLNFKINYTSNRIYLCGAKSVSSFFDLIGSSNPRQLIKYSHFLSNGFVPDTIQTERFLKHK